jgi:carbon starvation protein
MKSLAWIAVALLGAFALGAVALHTGERVNALWLMTAAACTYVLALRFYARFIASRVLGVDPARSTPAHRLEDGLDYVPTHPGVLFGHHFAAIAGAGPLIGPVLAAQMGYAPGALWIVVGAVLAGCVQDMTVLFLSTRRDGASLGAMIREQMGAVVGSIAQLGILLIMIVLLAVLALVVVKALAQSPWGTFTVAMTIPIAVFMGVYGRFLRPGRIGEMSIIGAVLLIGSVAAGAWVAADPGWARAFTLDGIELAWALMIYGFLASVLPVWLLLAPRDYLSTFLKIGTILLLAIGIVIVQPELKMPAFTRFVDGTGPIFAGNLFPFLFITIACGAVSGFHALIASGTTPKMLETEAHIAPIGYGAMLCESFVAMMALIAASALDPGVYFAVNSPAALIGTTAQSAADAVSQWGFVVTPEMLTDAARSAGEQSVLSRVGGAPTLALAMAQILAAFLGGAGATAFWYHFAILFEALFILTTLDAGTRVGRFLIQDFLGKLAPAWSGTRTWSANLVATALCVAGWGWFLYQGVVDPLGGINSLWPLFGISNQMLAAIALTLVTVALVRMGRARYAAVAGVPLAWLVACTLTAGWQKLFDADARIGFFSHISRFESALARGEVLAPAKSLVQMRQVIANDVVDAVLCAALMIVVASVAVMGLLAMRRAPDAGAQEQRA